MKFLIQFLLSGLLAYSTISVYAQSNSQPVSGIVFDALTKEPLLGVSVREADGKSGIVTDRSGVFRLMISQTRVIVSAVGYQSQTLDLNPGELLRISLQPAAEDLQTVIVTANREASLRTEAPIAISKLSPKLIDETKATSVFEVINKTPGVLMVNLGNE
jgi:hypothetical protein